MYAFVYGTLKKGFGNHILLDRDPITTIIVDLPYAMVSLGGFPALIPTPNIENQIQGEVYEITANDLYNLDGLEGYPRFYNRSTFPLYDFGINGRAWFYFIEDKTYIERAPRVLNGNWVG